MVGHGVGGVGDGRDGRRVVDERSGGGDHSAASSKDGGLSISRPLAIVTVTGVTIITPVSSVSVASVTVVTEASESVISNSDRDGVSGHFVLNLGGRQHIGLDNWSMSNSPNSGPNVGHTSGVGQTSAIQELWVSLS